MFVFKVIQRFFNTYLVKTIAGILIFIILFSNISVYAQEATSSATITPTETLTPSPTPTSNITPTTQPSPTPMESSNSAQLELTNQNATQEATLTPSPTPTIPPTLLLPSPVISGLTTNDTLNNFSASLQSKIKMVPISKNHISGKDRYEAALLNARGSRYRLRLLYQGVEVQDFSETSSLVGDTVNVHISPPHNFKPGKYTLEIIDQTGHKETQEFVWGVLAINTDKSIYLPHETAQLAMAVLNEQGNMVCDAQLVLKINNNQLNIHDELSTANGKIIVNSECVIHNYTEKPDFQSSYTVGQSGTYSINLTATTANGTYSIDDTFEVKDSVAFDVQRINATRIYPPQTYHSIMKITANKDFQGNIIESVPDSFAVMSPKDNAVKSFDSTSSDVINIDHENSDVLGASTVNLSLPFDGNFPITFGFGERNDDPFIIKELTDSGLPGHDGIDFAMPTGTPIKAADDGIVAPIKPGVLTYGMTIVIQHGWGKTYYGHLSVINVKPGQTVKRGETIGLSGETGIATGPHLHFGVMPNHPNLNNGYYGKVDPMSYLNMDNRNVLGAYTTTSKVKHIYWNVNVKKGDSLTIGYDYITPGTSPNFFLLGPLQFVNNGQTVFQETRQWQLAIDASINMEQQINIMDQTMTNNDGSGPMSVWKMDEGTGTNTADSVGTNDGTLINTPTWETGQIGQALTFAYTSTETVDLGNTASLNTIDSTTPVTYEAWIKTPQNGNMTILEKKQAVAPYTGWGFMTGGVGQLFFQMINTYSTNTLEVSLAAGVNYYDGNWHHVAATYDGSKSPSGVKLYFDGQSQTTATTVNTLTGAVTNSVNAYIGSRNNASQFFDGSIDEVRLYTSVRTAAQIQSDMNMTNGQNMGMVEINTSGYSATASYYFEVVGSTTSGAGDAYLVFNGGTGTSSTGGNWIKASGLGTSVSRVRSAAFTPTGSQLAYVNLIAGTGVTLTAARIIIVQTSATNITDTETQVEVGNNETSTSASYADLTDKKIFYYDSSKYNPAPTVNFEATMTPQSGGGSNIAGPRGAAASGNCVDATGIGTVTWTNPGNAFSTNTTYATASVDATTSHYIKCTSFGFSIPSNATVSGVVVSLTRKSNSTLNGGSKDAAIRLVKAGTIGSTDKSTATAYTTGDVTEAHGGSSDLWSDSWTPTDINNANFGAAIAVTKANSTGSAHTVYVDYISITVYYSVTYTTYASLYVLGGSQVAGSEVSTSNSTALVRTASPITLTNGTAYVVDIKSNSTGVSAGIENAKLILTQSSAGGISALETFQQYNNTLATNNTASYVSKGFPDSFNKLNFSGMSYKAYFESDLKTDNGSNAYYAQLSSGIGQVTAADTSYTRKTSGDIWSSLPASATDLDVQLKNASTSTTSSSNSWLIIDITPFTNVSPTLNQLLRHGKWFNNGVRQSFTF